MTTQTPDSASVRVAVETTKGNFTILLYGDTPKHRDNFVKLVNEHYYDSTLFHRVIKDFMVQTGDPDSRTARPGQRLGSGGPGYRIDAEIDYPKHFHKRYALAAARQGDQVNPKKESSGSQFYIVTGRRLTEQQVNSLADNQLAQRMQNIFNELAGARYNEIRELQSKGDKEGLETLRQQLIAETEAKAKAEGAPSIPEEVRFAYTTVGGAPHLDGAYTVFGEVTEGQDVIDRIEEVQTDGSDRPAEDIRIISMRVLPADNN
ncbi:MAG: peptidylprolyl isomerase [Muribaculaceae bacterium]|nr:peptidylprolyl isomerase [Muribaculaceae bacterium]